MAFRFPLQAILHFRQSMEHQQEMRLRAANQRLARVRHMIEQIERGVLQLHAQSSQQLGLGTTSAELRFALESKAARLRQRQELEQEHARLALLRDQQLRIFQLARQERETIETLREEQSREHNREAARREQRRLDDLYLLRRPPHPRG